MGTNKNKGTDLQTILIIVYLLLHGLEDRVQLKGNRTEMNKTWYERDEIACILEELRLRSVKTITLLILCQAMEDLDKAIKPSTNQLAMATTIKKISLCPLMIDDPIYKQLPAAYYKQ